MWDQAHVARTGTLNSLLLRNTDSHLLHLWARKGETERTTALYHCSVLCISNHSFTKAINTQTLSCGSNYFLVNNECFSVSWSKVQQNPMFCLLKKVTDWVFFVLFLQNVQTFWGSSALALWGRSIFQKGMKLFPLRLLLQYRKGQFECACQSGIVAQEIMRATGVLIPRWLNQKFAEAGSYRNNCPLLGIYGNHSIKWIGELKMQLNKAIFSTARPVLHHFLFRLLSHLSVWMQVYPDHGTG